MKIFRILLLIYFIGIQNITIAQNYSVVDEGSSVTFSIKNLGFVVNGSFKNLQGNIVFDANHLSTSTFNITVNAASVDTKNNARDKHLKKEEYFDVDKYPTIAFIADKIEKETIANTFKVRGRFIIKNQSKQVAFSFTATPNANGLTFLGKVNLNRRDFKVGGSSLILSDNLILSLNVLARKK